MLDSALMKSATPEYMEFLRLSELDRPDEADQMLTAAVNLRDPLALHTRAYEAEDSDPPRIAEALKLYRMAARQDYEPSIMNLARHYESRHSARRYFYWLRRAAKLGSPEALEELERPFPYLVSQAVHELEDGGEIDGPLAVFRLAARHGNVDAMINLANLYDLKFNPPRSRSAERLYKKAAAAGSELAASNLEQHYADLEYGKKFVRHSDILKRLGQIDI